MSIYVMTVGELAKKRGEPVGEFVKKVQSVGFGAGSHAKKLTQADLDVLIGLLDGTTNSKPKSSEEQLKKELLNPNVLMVKTSRGSTIVALVETSLNEDGTISVEIVDSSEEKSLGETLLEFRKKLGMNLGINL